MSNLLCWLGLHSWAYRQPREFRYRGCRRCRKDQIFGFGKWWTMRNEDGSRAIWMGDDGVLYKPSAFTLDSDEAGHQIDGFLKIDSGVKLRRAEDRHSEPSRRDDY